MKQHFLQKLVHMFHKGEKELEHFKHWLFVATDMSKTGEVFAEELQDLLLILTRDGVFPESFLARPPPWVSNGSMNKTQASAQVAVALVREFSLTSDRDTLDEVEFDGLAELVINELVVSQRLGTHRTRKAGGFKLLRTIGLGAESVVKLGHGKREGSEDPEDSFAILISPRIPSVVLRQMREAAIESRLRGVKGVVRTLGRFGSDSFLFTQKELCICSLEFALAQCGPSFSEDISRFITCQILKIIAALHKCRVVHRDISADNILIGKDGTLKLTDFGIAEMLPCKSSGPTAHKKRSAPVYARFPGNRCTIPPECIRGGDADPYAIDIFQCGVLLFRMITGHYPFPEVRNFDGSDVRMRSEYPDLSMLSHSLRRLLRGLLAPDPEKRFTAEEALHMSWFNGDHKYPLIPLTRIVIPLTHNLTGIDPPEGKNVLLYEATDFGVMVSIRTADKYNPKNKEIILHKGYIWDFRGFIKSLLTAH